MKPPPTCKDCPSRDHDTCYYYPKSPMPIVKDEPFRFDCPLIFKKEKKIKVKRSGLPISETLYSKEWMREHYTVKQLSTVQIAELVGRSKANIVTWLHTHEIKLRNKTEDMRLWRERKMKNLDMKARCK